VLDPRCAGDTKGRAGRRGEEDTVEVFAVSETRCIGMLLWEKA